ncbi:MAG: ABC transporter permease subunit [Luteitalea sp.]|nr:ABC transporter permease subunit [Luteitalea sp.]
MGNAKVHHPLVELTLARVREFLREPEALFWVFLFPVLMTCALGLAFGREGTTTVDVGVLAAPGADERLAALAAAPDLDARLLSRPDAEIALRKGSIQVLVVPGTPPVYRFDPTRPESQLARLAVDEALQRAAGRRSLWKAREERVVAPGARYVDWVVPGLLGMNIMGTGMWSIGFAVVLARTRKLLKRLVASPMRRAHYLLSHMLARLLFLTLEVVTLVGFAVIVFDVPINGSWLVLAAVCVLGAATFSGLGLLLVSRVKTIEAASGLMNFAMVPMWVFSGVFFSSEHFPSVMQPFVHALPLTALTSALRGVMLDGQGLLGLTPHLANLAGWTVVCYLLALRLFRWR